MYCIRKRTNGGRSGFSPLKTSTIVILIIVIFTTTSESRTCSEENCKFGGKCETRIMYGRPGPKVCKCPSVKCYQGLYEPVCGSDGNTYYNALCMIMEECEGQKTITPVCFGPCGSQLCEDTRNTKTLHRSCTSSEQGYCKNGGLCYHHILLGQTRCKCNDRFEGRRCEKRVLTLFSTKENPKPTDNDCLIYKIGLALMTGLLLAITAYHLITCALKKKNREIKAKCTLWPNEKKSKGKQSLQDIEERRPLRSARSDEDFSNRPRVNGTSE